MKTTLAILLAVLLAAACYADQSVTLRDKTYSGRQAAVDASGNVSTKGASNSGVDIGDVTVNNASGANAVNVQDGGNTLTVDGTVAATQSGTWNIATLTSITNAVAVTGTFWQATQPVSGTFWQATQPVSGTFWQATQPVSIASMPTTTVTATDLDIRDLAGATDNVGIFGYNGTNYQAARIDTSTRAWNTIDYSHHEIHSGSAFMANYFATGKNDGTTINIYFKTPDTTKWGHMLMQWSASGAAFGRIYEAPTITANTGTNGQAILNHNRNSAGTSVMLDNALTPAANKYGYDVTKTGDGTIIFVEYAGAAKSQGGMGRNEGEIILKQNTAYLFEVESDAAGLTLNLNLSWYEHTDLAA